MNIEPSPGLSQARDFREECDALFEVLAAAPAAAWHKPTQFKGWTFDDVVGHLHMFDYAAELAARGRPELKAFFDPVMKSLATGSTFRDVARDWLQGCAGPALLERWRSQYQRLADLYLGLDPNLRLPWAGPDMSTRSFMSARQMEAWAHGQAIFDALGRERVEFDRLRNVAIMGVNTFGWTFTVHGNDVPPVQPYVRLTSPSGATWQWNDPASTDRVEGSAVDFCRVVTQMRHVLDTNLRVHGPAAEARMGMAQCFAGPPEMPPAPATRFVQR